MAKQLKYWHMRLEERNGEQEYSYNYLIRAKTEGEAWELARKMAASFYGEDEDGNPEGTIVDGDDCVYEFPGLWIVVKIDDLSPTTKGEYVRRMLEHEMIGGYDHVK